MSGLSKVPFLVAGVCLLVEAFFSGSEIAVVAADRLRIRQGSEAGSRSSRRLLEMLAAPQRLLATTLMGTQLAIVTASVTMTLFLSGRYGTGRGELYTLVALTPVLVVFGEIVPKSVAQQYADTLAPALVWPLILFQRLFAPAVWVMARFTTWVARRFGLPARSKMVTREDLAIIVNAKGAGSGEITEGERRMISRIFDFGDSTAYDVMVPLSSVAALDEAESAEHAVREVSDKGYTRFPVFRERIDRVVGLLHAFDVLKAPRDAPLGSVMQAPVYVPENQPLSDVLVELQRSRKGMAVVVDEYGGAVGVVTIEDILEEIVGEIEDEYDTAPPAIRKEADGSFRVRGRTPIRELNRQLKQELPEGEDYETVAGLVIDHLKHIPRVGESVRIGNLLIKVTEASERAVEEVQVRLGKRR